MILELKKCMDFNKRKKFYSDNFKKGEKSMDSIILPLGYTDEEEAKNIYEETFNTVYKYLKINGMDGNILEFGTYKGYTARKLAKYIKKYTLASHLYVYDSFEGLPEIKSDIDLNSYQVSELRDWGKGTFMCDEGTDKKIKHDISQIIGENRIHIIKGFFKETLPTYKFDENSAILINIDCDLYESVKIVLSKLVSSKVLKDGSVILFDDYNFNRSNPKLGVRKAIIDTFCYQSKYLLEDFFSYGWHGKAFFVHDMGKEFCRSFY
jgi:hypothetical protein